MSEEPDEEECSTSQLSFEANGLKVRLAGRHALLALLAAIVAYVILSTV